VYLKRSLTQLSPNRIQSFPEAVCSDLLVNTINEERRRREGLQLMMEQGEREGAIIIRSGAIWEQIIHLSR
jgi:hypothetical protein